MIGLNKQVNLILMSTFYEQLAQICEYQFSRVLIGSRISLAIHCFATGAKMAPRFETFSEDEIWPINETVVQTNTKKATNFGLSVFTGR